MDTISNNQRYLPHELNTKFYACKLYAARNHSVAFICRRYKISKASLMRWMKRFDGTKESLIDRSHRPHSKHPNAHTDEEIRWINNYIRRNPNIPMIELYTKLRINRGYTRHPASLFRFLRKQGFYPEKKAKEPKYKPKPYNTPKNVGIKWQMDVKHVPKECKAPSLGAHDKFYQYTVIDEASRERFIYHYEEYNSYNTVEFTQRAILYFGYKPKTIQTDNGAEFVHLRDTKRKHAFAVFCEKKQYSS